MGGRWLQATNYLGFLLGDDNFMLLARRMHIHLEKHSFETQTEQFTIHRRNKSQSRFQLTTSTHYLGFLYGDGNVFFSLLLAREYTSTAESLKDAGTVYKKKHKTKEFTIRLQPFLTQMQT